MLGALGAEIATPEPPPSADLLLYLGEFEDAGGEFVDPMALDELKTEAAIDDQTVAPQIEEAEDDEAAPRSA